MMWKHGPGICGSDDNLRDDGSNEVAHGPTAALARPLLAAAFPRTTCFKEETHAACVAVKDDKRDKALAYCGGLRDPGVAADRRLEAAFKDCCLLKGEAKLKELCNTQGKVADNQKGNHVKTSMCWLTAEEGCTSKTTGAQHSRCDPVPAGGYTCSKSPWEKGCKCPKGGCQ